MDKDAVIRKALRFPIEPVLKRYIRYFGVSEDEAHEHELELKRYLVLTALNKGKKYSVSAPVTNLWLTFIVSTVLYSEFCSAIAGTYIHYAPPEPGAATSDSDRETYSELLRDYEAVFKVEPPSHIWPRDFASARSAEMVTDERLFRVANQY